MDSLMIKLIAGIVSLGISLGLAVVGVVSLITEPTTMKSKKLIEPRIELIITNNQPDTLFVYEVK